MAVSRFRELLLPWGHQPLESIAPNLELLGPDAIVWSAANRQELWVPGRVTFSSEGSFGGLTPGLHGLGAEWTRTANAGLDFGTRQPMASNAGVSILFVGEPIASAAQHAIVSQRLGSGSFQTFSLYTNATNTLGAGSGHLTLFSRNSSSANQPVHVNNTNSGIDGLPHCWMLGNDVFGGGYAFRDGLPLTLTTNTALTGTYVSTSQKLAIGNAAAYTTDGQYVCDDPIYLIIAWPRLVPADTARQLTELLTHNIGEAFEPQRIFVPVTTGGSSVAIGQVSETDTALALTGRHTVALGLVSETDVAQPLTAVEQLAVGLVEETDVALGLTGAQTSAVGQAQETDSALALASSQVVTLGQVAEVDEALAIAAAHVGHIGIVSETDAALAVEVSGAATLGLVSESDEAQTLGALQARAVGMVSETGTALALTALLTAEIGIVVETDTALALAASHAAAIGRVDEIDAALALVGSDVLAIGIVEETAVAQPLTALQALTLGLVLEIDTAFALTALHAAGIGMVSETDTALTLANAAPEHVPVEARTWHIPAVLRVWQIPRS